VETPATPTRENGSEVAPVVTPLAPPPAGDPADKVEVKLESVPVAQVFPFRSAFAWCTTPCTVGIDPNDGGPTDKRRFVVRHTGYRDKVISIDLKQPRERIHVDLEALPKEASRQMATPRERRQKPARGARGGDSDGDDGGGRGNRRRPSERPGAEPGKTRIAPEDTLDPFGNR
jgi:hypothetical protein